ncbi:hypothetical protein CR513_49578, partial [Mucuna pruriens]
MWSQLCIIAMRSWLYRVGIDYQRQSRLLKSESPHGLDSTFGDRVDLWRQSWLEEELVWSGRLHLARMTSVLAGMISSGTPEDLDLSSSKDEDEEANLCLMENTTSEDEDDEDVTFNNLEYLQITYQEHFQIP